MKFSELLDHCQKCIKSFNPVIMSLDSHADEYISQFKDPYEKVFVKQVFYGCIRYQEFLKIFTKVFFEKNSSSTNRNDNTLYQIFAYLSFFRLDELQTADYKKLVMSQEATKMHVFLQFAFNADLLREHLREEWMTLYDYSYIDEKIINGVERNLPSIADIIKSVEKRATGKVQSALSIASSQQHAESTEYHDSASRLSRPDTLNASMLEKAEQLSDGGEEPPKKKTEFVPFNLTKPKPKMIPPPEQIKREVKAKPVPKGMFTKTLADVEAEKAARRQATTKAIKNDYDAGAKQRFELKTEKLQSNQKVQKAKDVQEERVTAQLKFEGNRARPMPDFDKKEANVRLNVAALKREKYLIDKEEVERETALAEMAMGLKDASEFNRWKREMDEADEVARLEHIAKKKIEMELAREEAILAQERKEKENNEVAKKMKVDMEKRMEEREKNLNEAMEQKKEVIASVHANKDAAAEEVVKKQQDNKRIRDEVHKEMQDLAKKRADEMAHELAKKQELIRQIRELEKIPIQRTKGFDPTEAGGHGLMEEMSVAELRERLEFNKRQREQELAFKRETNLTKKEQEAQKLIEESKKIEEARLRRKNQNDARRQSKNAAADALAAKTKAAREKGLLEVHGKINQKKKEKAEEEARLAQELKEIRLQRQYLNANAAMVEEKAWKELEAGKERQIRGNQNDRLIDQSKSNEIMVKDQRVRADNAKSTVVNKLEYDKGYSDRLNTRKKENEVLHKNTLEYKSQQHQKQHDNEQNLKEAQKKRQPFNAKINEQSLAKATLYRKKQENLQKANREESLEYIARQGQMQEDEEFGLDMEGESAMDMLGEAENLQDNIAAKLDQE